MVGVIILFTSEKTKLKDDYSCVNISQNLVLEYTSKILKISMFILVYSPTPKLQSHLAYPHVASTFHFLISYA